MAHSVTIPSVMWAFNPTFIRIEDVEERSSASVTIGGRTIEAPLFQGSTDIQINSLVQLMFTEPRTTRSMKFTVHVESDDVYEQEILAIWGCLDYGDKYFQFGRMIDNAIVRKVRYYSNFPFTIDELSANGFTHRTITQEGDYTSSFIRGSVITRVVQNIEREGIYLRWVDRFGFTQYFLFKKGEKDVKAKADGNDIGELKNVYGLGYTQHFRPLNIATTDSIKVCADNLDLDEIDYVTSIVGSPIVDMYIDGDWKPIRVEDGTFKYSVHHLTMKQDFEITIITNERESQSL